MQKNEPNPLAKLRENVPLFFGLTDDELSSLLDASQRRILPDGRLVVSEGTLSTKLFIILAGKALVSRRHSGGTEVIATLHSGATFGEMGVVDSGPRSAQVMTQGETVVLEIDREVLEQAEPTILVKVFRNVALIVSRRLREANRAMETMSFKRQDQGGDPVEQVREKGLDHAVLTEVSAQNVDFSRADLRGADFTGADLRGAIFIGADMRDANFDDAYLEDSMVSEPPEPDSPGGEGEGDCIEFDPDSKLV